MLANVKSLLCLLVWMGLTDRSLALTCTHDVISEEWSSEPKGQHEQVASKSWIELFEACGIGAKVGKGSCHQNTMWMETQYVVLFGVQVSCLYQLWKIRKYHLVFWI